MSYQVIVTDDAEQDLRELAAEDREAARAAVELGLELREDPYLGQELRDRPGVGNLRDCRSIHFDRANWKGKPRYRLVYRNEPRDAAPQVIAVLSVGSREKLRAYRDAVLRRIRRVRGGARGPDQG